MALVQSTKPVMSLLDLVTFVKNELDADEDRQAKASAASAGELPRESQTGSTVDLSHKNINTLPVEVILLIKDKVERLALSHNPRIALPIEIGQCDRLRYLNLRWNKLRQFPMAVLTLSKLEILDISKNQIDGIPEDIKKMTNLKYLAVARNQIKRLPLALGEMSLVKLKFDENPIEFPPPEALKPSADRTTFMVESEKDKDMCQQVKRYMKTMTMRARLTASSDEDLSNVEVTPRPPKRGLHGGRFPVRPSVSDIEHIQDLKSESPPDHIPPIPQRSHARGMSSSSQFGSRPSIAPLFGIGSDGHRSRSESVASNASMRNRRQGYVPRKNTGLGSLSEMSSQMSARSSQAATLTPPHSRAPSVTSTFNGFLNIGSGGESSEAASPIDGPVNRNILSRKLASLPESRNSRPPTLNSIKVVKRVLLMLFYLYRPIADIAQQIGAGSSKRSGLERQLFSANANVEELDRLLNGANSMIEDGREIDQAFLTSITRTAITALKMYIFVIKEVNRSRHQIAKRVDAFHVRCVLNTSYSTLVEARNICHMLGFQTKTSPKRDTLRPSQAWSSRTVTPTQPRSSSSRRRGNTVLPISGSTTNLRGAVPPVPLHSNGSRGSRSNTMVSQSGPPARLNESYPGLSQSRNTSRNNTMRSAMGSMPESEGEDGADRVYMKLKACCDLAAQTLPPVRAELFTRKTNADNTGHPQSSHRYAQAVNKCDFMLATNSKLLSRLKVMRVGDPARYQHEIRMLTEGFAKDWANFAGEVMVLAAHRLEIGNIKASLKPVQSAVKEATRASTPPQTASYTQGGSTLGRPPPTPSFHNNSLPSLNTSLTPVPGLATPVTATPLSAALGPAAQATVPPVQVVSSPEYYPQQAPSSRSRPADRFDSSLPPGGYSRR
ncbi:unnamed protein product [Zymoseptoria tritici ST99CH_1A5]|uniref:Disease resistance R13L4/SHOC-2-like LRR domain-containing protein n=2 Tax=Zymoseptoria tritici TaxID=1047171 RepID=A0A2H1H598_ZYMTR|nr:unnamed protein product [Zymoseptoria tritici ST99CH_1E4]SMY29479.1 unnamed protein product [Zymoseptoria tritici ST99CH_1A5]